MAWRVALCLPESDTEVTGTDSDFAAEKCNPRQTSAASGLFATTRADIHSNFRLPCTLQR